MEKSIKNAIKYQFKLYHQIVDIEKHNPFRENVMDITIPKYAPIPGKGFAKVVWRPEPNGIIEINGKKYINEVFKDNYKGWTFPIGRIKCQIKKKDK